MSVGKSFHDMVLGDSKKGFSVGNSSGIEIHPLVRQPENVIPVGGDLVQFIGSGVGVHKDHIGVAVVSGHHSTGERGGFAGGKTVLERYSTGFPENIGLAGSQKTGSGNMSGQ